MNSTAAAVPRRRLTQRGAAFWLAAGLIAIPAVPTVLDIALPERNWDTVEAADQVDIISANGNSVVIDPPDNTKIQDQGDSAVLRTNTATITVAIYDKSDRDADLVTQRLLRMNRVEGINAALDGGNVATGDGALTGASCVLVAGESSGNCAFLSDDDVIVSVLTVADPGETAPPIDVIVGLLTKGQS
jgi:hypothetical protein